LPEPDDMIRAGEEALRSAQILLSEGLWADAISRAYYTMVYAARALLASKGLAPRTHRVAIQLFVQEFVRTGLFPSGVAKLLTATMAFRDRADYGLRKDLTEEDARRAVEAGNRLSCRAAVFERRAARALRQRSRGRP